MSAHLELAPVSHVQAVLDTVDHPSWGCPGPELGHHSAEWACCPCDHGLAGCCYHAPDCDEPGTHDHRCRTDVHGYGTPSYRQALDADDR